MNDVAVSTIMVDLDVILDTRLSTILAIDDDILEHVLTDGYHDRKQDVFTGIDKEVYDVAYANRTKAILKNACITPILGLVAEFVEKTIKLTLSSPIHKQPRVDVNVYPYVLTDSEANDIISAIRHHTNSLADISIVSLDYETITPKYLKEHISIYVTYDYINWLETHAANDNLKTTTCPEVTMFAPAIYFKDPVVSTIDPFKAMETINGIFIGLKLLAIEHFSVIRPNS